MPAASVDVVVCILFFCTIDDFAVLMGRVFRLGWVRVAETGANIRDVVDHGCSAGSFVVVPLDVAYLFPVQSVVMVYLANRAERRCSACSFLTYSMPKSSTMRTNTTGLHLCLHRPGVVAHWKYPC